MADISSLPEHCTNPSYNGRNLTNRVLQQQHQLQGQKNITYYCPVYVRTKIKNFAKMSFQDLDAEVNVTLIITINFRGVMGLVQSKARQLLKVGFNRDDSIQITEDSMTVSKRTEQPGIYTYTVRKRINTAMMANVIWSPFQLIYLILSVSIPNIQMNSQIIKEIIEGADKHIKNSQVQLKKNKIIQSIKENQSYIQRYVFRKGLQQIQYFFRTKLQTKGNLEKIKKQKQTVEKINSQKKLKLQRKLSLQKNFKQIDQADKNNIMKILLFEKQKKELSKIRMINIRFNFMDCDERLAKISYSAEGTFGNYDLAQSKLGVQYTFKSSSNYVRNKKKKPKSENQPQKIDYSVVKPFCYAHFEIPLYKFPGVTLLTIFLPLWLLGILNLGIFFQSVGLADRIGSLSGLMIAFVALIPVIRQQLPQSPSVAFVQILVYTQAYGTIICFIQSINVRNYKQYNFIWYENGFFMVTLIIELTEMFLVAVILLIHKCYWERDYNRSESKKEVKFNYKKWENVKCDQHFRRKLDNSLITVTEVNDENQKIKEHLMKLEQQQQKMQEFQKEEQKQMAVNAVLPILSQNQI